MAQQGNVWENNSPPPIQMGGVVLCPICNSEIAGPFSATLSNNKIVKKWGCTKCNYVWKIEGGSFKNAFEANPVTFG